MACQPIKVEIASSHKSGIALHGGSAINYASKTALAVATFAAFCLGCPSGASAQDADEASIEDTEYWFRFAREAAERGDLPAAIAALERVLLNNPDLANIRLELGLLYLRAGNAPLARNYLEDAINAPDAPEVARIRAREALANVDVSMERTRFSGTAQAGIRYQSNPNGSPGEVSLVLPGGTPVIIDSDGLSISRDDDFSIYASVSGELAHSLGGQRRTSLVASGTLATQTFFDLGEIDSIFIGGEFGPRFMLGSTNAPDGFIRPFVSVSHLDLGSAAYFTSYGGGLDVSAEPSLGVLLTGRVAYLRRDYSNSSIRPRATDQTGDYITATGTAFFQLSPRTNANIGVLAEFADANADYWSRTSLGASAGLSHTVDLGPGSRGILRIGSAYRRSDYDAVDPLVSLTQVREEDRFEIYAAFEIPISRNFSVDTRVQQTWNNAALPNYDYKNALASLGLRTRF